MDEWHFPRLDLAKHYLDILNIGISSNLAIIAPRRKGKTLFVLQDLSPLSQKHQYLPVYASLWQNVNSPHEGLILALEEAIEVLNTKSKLSNILKTNIKKTTLNNDLLGKIELEFADNPLKATSKDLMLLEKMMNELQKKAGKKTILLLVDEIQHLATSPAFAPLSHALRTILDKRQGKIKTIFTGSSRHYMNLLFNKSLSPFYHFVEPVTFPELGEEFIDFMVSKLQNEHGILVTKKALQQTFTEIDKSPYWMMKIISRLVTFKDSLKESKDYVLQLLEEAEDFGNIVQKLKPIDQIIYLAITENKNPFSQELMEKIDTETNIKGIASNIQRSIQRLIKLRLISTINKGEYYTENPGLSRYLKERKCS